MKAIIINDTDARALLDKLKLQSLTADGHIFLERPYTIESIHRVFHYVVCRWLQEQGADVVGQ